MVRSSSFARRAMLAGVAVLALGAISTAPAEAAPPEAALHGTAAPGHGRVEARRARHRFARRAGHRPARVVLAHRGPRFGAAGLPAGYASDESAYDVGAEGNQFDTGAFYGCLHTVLTAGGYRPDASCQ